MTKFRLNSPGSLRGRVFVTLGAVNLALTATTGLFIYAWGRMDAYSPAVQHAIKYVLVQGHLATENVLAAWYSSMLLLSVGLLALAAFAADRRRGSGRLRAGWLPMSAAFVVLSLDEIGSFHERVGMVAALGGSADRPMGWAYVLAGPIALVAIFLIAFAWLHVRASRSAFWQMAAGVALFVVNPAFERVEMMLIHGARTGASERLAHDALLVVEEGLLELFGTLCFASGVFAYLGTVTGGRFEWRVTTGRALATVAGLTGALAVGVPVSMFVVARLPAGDTGIAANWFPATAFFLLAAACALHEPDGAARPIVRMLAVLALALSAYFGAGIYGYTDWPIDVFSPHLPVAGTIVAGAVTAAVVWLSSRDDSVGRPS